MNNLIELFAIPIGLKPVIIVDNIPLFGSKSLNEKFIESLPKSKRGKLISKTVKIMIENEKIIPCFADSGIFSYFRRRLSQDTSGGLLRILRNVIAKKPIDHPLDYTYAFYDNNINKIVILINNHILEKFSFTASINSIALALTHEMMHMYAHQNPHKFLNFFRNELNSYYLTYFKEIFKLNNEKGLENVVESIYRTFFLKNEITSSIYVTNIVRQLYKLKPFSSLDNDKFGQICTDYVRIVKLLLTTDTMKFISLVKMKYKYIIVPLYETYKNVFEKIPPKGCAQELIYPSEVICGYSDIILDTKIKTALKSL